MLEKDVEKKLASEAKKRGLMCIKLVSVNLNGLPDRLILTEDGRVGFVELKAPGKKPRLLQIRRHEELKKRGFKVFVLDDVEKIGGILDEICTS